MIVVFHILHRTEQIPTLKI